MPLAGVVMGEKAGDPPPAATPDHPDPETTPVA
jgi:hypothetical protein